MGMKVKPLMRAEPPVIEKNIALVVKKGQGAHKIKNTLPFVVTSSRPVCRR